LKVARPIGLIRQSANEQSPLAEMACWFYFYQNIKFKKEKNKTISALPTSNFLACFFVTN